MEKLQSRYLERLAELYPSIAKASKEIINLQAILSLPKGTEHFLTDIHGEYEAFAHVLKNGSGAVRRKIEQVFGNTLSNKDKQALATLIYYPKEKINHVKKVEDNMEDWYKITLYRLIQVCKNTASKYTRSKVRKAMPEDYAYVIEELITENGDTDDKENYYNTIINTIVEIGGADDFIVAMSRLIQRLAVDHLHILGDIYDRGPGPHLIMDKLMTYHSVDIQWGNHDIAWMGAASGQRACIANVIRICARYGNLDILEDGYGINLLPLATYTLDNYGDDPCEHFKLKASQGVSKAELNLNMKIHKAITILQFKLDGQTIMRNPEFGMEKRMLLHRINYEKGTIEIDGKTYELLDCRFPTIDPENPYALTEEEEFVMERLERAFLHSEKLQSHMRFLLNKGSLYKVYNNNLLYHGCVPLNEDGSFKVVNIYGNEYSGKGLYEVLESYVRKGFRAIDKEEREHGKDIMWYIWLSENSPLYGKDKMATFECQLMTDKELQKEKKNPYYKLLENEAVADMIMDEFGLEKDCRRIVNGHVPVKSKDGESPIKCNGKVLVIDGGFSKAYQKATGIAGYTLIYNSHGLVLAAHEPFESKEAAIENESDIHSKSTIIKQVAERKMVRDTDDGKVLMETIKDLEQLLEAYRSGRIAEKL